MRRCWQFLVLAIGISQNGIALPVLPAEMKYPILFVHGYNASPESWGFDVGDEWKGLDEDKTPPDNTEVEAKRFFEPGETNNGFELSPTAYMFAKHFYPSFGEPGGIPNTEGSIGDIGIECFNASDRHATGYKNQGPTNPGIEGIADELYQRIGQVLNEYYGTTWPGDPSKRIVVICHSQGGLLMKDLFMTPRMTNERSATRMYNEPVANPMEHIDRVVTVGTPYRGSPWGNPETVTYGWSIVREVMSRTDKILDLFAPVVISEKIQPDPFEDLRTQLQGMIRASVNFDATSDFIQRVQADIARKPNGDIQPWIFLVSFGSPLLASGLDRFRAFLDDWQDETAWKKYVYESYGGALTYEWVLNYIIGQKRADLKCHEPYRLKPYLRDMTLEDPCNEEASQEFVGRVLGDVAMFHRYYSENVFSGCSEPPPNTDCDPNYGLGIGYNLCVSHGACREFPAPRHPVRLRQLWEIHREITTLNGAGDVIVPQGSQTLYGIYPSHAKQKAVFEFRCGARDGGRWHSEEPTMYKAFLAAIELDVTPVPETAASVRSRLARP